MNKIQYNVSGIQNQENKTKIKNALDKIRGIQEISVDPATGTIKVEYNEPANEMQIKSCIENSGFKLE